MQPALCVAICTYDRAPLLRQCLEGLIAQTVDQGALQIVVVDNNSTDETAAVVREAREKIPTLTYVFEGKQGLSRARNTAIASATAPIIAYIDDDAIPYPDWAERFIEAFDKFPDCAVIGGESEPIFESERPAWLDDDLLKSYSCGLNYSADYHYIQGKEWLLECNLGYRLGPLQAAGGFSERLGRNGSLLLSGDGAVNELIAHAGGKMLYAPFVKVRHLVPTSRMNPKWLGRRRFWGGVSEGVIEDYLLEATGEIEPWKDLFLPSKIQDWEGVVNLPTDENFASHLSRLFNIGYLLAKTGMISI